MEDERSPERDLLSPTDLTVSRLAATVVDGVDEAAQFELYSLSHRLCVQSSRRGRYDGAFRRDADPR